MAHSTVALLPCRIVASKRKVDISETLPPEDVEDAVSPLASPPVAAKRDVETSDTLPPEDAENAKQPAGSLPVTNWDLYELLELLGKGGMGVVYKARDRRLNRTVAIKFLLGADPDLTVRFLREARAQARIDHPNICRVYQTGEVEGRAYIALQFIDGEPLHKASARMSLDEKIAVMRDVAMAVQEAHREGIVHRDLKPANIMVAHTEEARWHPVVMDFGLAREATVEIGITASGALLGTPAYMSPEQARGDWHAVDRRSDVYSLGATLYELLTGRTPFADPALALMLAQVIHDDPPAPRSLAPSLPVDLETIALKCLAKDPAQRYPSARALADDLGRYLNGEPILGRRLSLWQRVRMRARRHRALVALGAWSLAIICAVAALGIREHVLTTERTDLAERLARETAEIEGYLREAYQWPLHDTRADRDRIRARMAQIAATHPDLGDLGDAVIHEALGRGHLALHEWRAADDELARAEKLARADADGRRMAKLHAARGRALGELYRRALEEARPQSDEPADKARLARRQQELQEQYLTPALAELEQSRASSEDADLLEARIALYRRDFADAELRAHRIAEDKAGASEARRIAADAAYGAGMEALDHGNYYTARLKLEDAAKQYAEASEIARSDASLYEASAQTLLQLAEVDSRQKRSPRARESLERALDLIDNYALHADPDDVPAYTTKSHVFLRWYLTSSLPGQDDPRALLDRTAEAAHRAVEIDPQDADAWVSLGNAHIHLGRHEVGDDGQGTSWYECAFEELAKALMINPDDVRANNALGTVHRWFGTRLGLTGLDPRIEYQAALRSYERVSEIDPQDLPACTNQVDLHTTIAEYDEMIGMDPRPSLDSAQRVGERCLAIDHNFPFLLDDMAQVQLALARYLLEHEGDPMPALTRARDYLDHVQPESTVTWYHRAVAANTEARFRLVRGDELKSYLHQEREVMQNLQQLRPDWAYSYVQSARLDLTEAEWAARTPRGSASALASARTDAEKAISLGGQDAAVQLTAAEVYLQIAKTQPSRESVEPGICHAKEAIRLNPQLRRARIVLQDLLQLNASQFAAVPPQLLDEACRLPQASR